MTGGPINLGNLPKSELWFMMNQLNVPSFTVMIWRHSFHAESVKELAGLSSMVLAVSVA